MGRIKDIAIKIENDESLTKLEFEVAKESGLNGVKVGDKYFIVDWLDGEIVIDGELINTYGGNFIYRDVIAKITGDSVFTLHEKQYGQCDDCDEFKIDDDSEIEEIVLVY